MKHVPAWLTLLAGFLILSGCGPARFTAQTAPSATPTWAPVPTFTPTVAPLATPLPADTPTPAPPTQQPTPAPTEEGAAVGELAAAEGSTDASASDLILVPTATPDAVVPSDAPPISEAALTVIAESANVRAGPGTDYPQIGVALRDAQFPVMGRNAAGDWWQVCCFAEQSGWLFSTLVTTLGGEAVAVVDVPPPPVAAVAPEPTVPPASEEGAAPVADAEVPAAEAPAEAEPIPAAPVPVEHGGTAGTLDPNAQYQIVHYRVLGFDDNNGGIFNKGGQQIIFVTVLDQAGNGVDGAVLKDAVGDKLNVVTGSKGPGKAEIKMDWDPYKLYVAADPAGAVTSQISNQMNNPYPHIPDVIGRMGPADNEYAICPTVDDRCTPPFYHAHWSYEIVFQKVK